MKNKGKLSAFAVAGVVCLIPGILSGCVKGNQNENIKLGDEIELSCSGVVKSNKEENKIFLGKDGNAFKISAGEKLELNDVKFSAKSGSKDFVVRVKFEYYLSQADALVQIENVAEVFTELPVMDSSWLFRRDGFYYLVNEGTKEWSDGDNSENLFVVSSQSQEVSLFDQNSHSIAVSENFDSNKSVMVEVVFDAVEKASFSSGVNNWKFLNPLKENLSLTFNLEGGNLSQNKIENITEGQVIDLTNYVPTKTGFTFDGWSFGDKKVEGLEFGKTNISLTANWKKNLHAVYDADGGVWDYSDSETYFNGDSLTITTNEPTKQGFTFAGWKVGDSIVSTSTLKFSEDEDIVLVAVWKKNLYLTCITGEDVYFKSSKKFSGDEISLPENPTKENYTFDGWIDEKGDSVSGKVTFEEDDITLTAVWKKNLHLSYQLKGGKWSYSDDKIYFKNENVTLTTTQPQRQGFEFEGWCLNDAKVEEVTFVEDDIVVEAKWIKVTEVSYITEVEDKSLLPQNFTLRGSEFNLPQVNGFVVSNGKNLYVKCFLISGKEYEPNSCYDVLDSDMSLEVSVIFDVRGVFHVQADEEAVIDEFDIYVWGEGPQEASLPKFERTGYRLRWKIEREDSFEAVSYDEETVILEGGKQALLVPYWEKATTVKKVYLNETEKVSYHFDTDENASIDLENGSTSSKFIKWRCSLDGKYYQDQYDLDFSNGALDLVLTETPVDRITVCYVTEDGQELFTDDIFEDHEVIIRESIEKIVMEENNLTGFTICGWTDGNLTFKPGEVVKFGEDKNLQAVLAKVVFNEGSNAGGALPCASFDGDSLVLPKCTYEHSLGYEFRGWEFDGNIYVPGDKVQFVENMEFTAIWQDQNEESFTVEFDFGEGFVYDEDGQGENVIELEFEKEISEIELNLGERQVFKTEDEKVFGLVGFEVSGGLKASVRNLNNLITIDFGKDENGNKNVVKQNIVLTAVWAQLSNYEITFELEEGESVVDVRTGENAVLNYDCTSYEKNMNARVCALEDFKFLKVTSSSKPADKYAWSLCFFNSLNNDVSVYSDSADEETGLSNWNDGNLFMAVPGGIVAKLIWTEKYALEIRPGKIDNVEISGSTYKKSITKYYKAFEEEIDFVAPGYSFTGLRYYDKFTGQEISEFANVCGDVVAFPDWVDIGFVSDDVLIDENPVKPIISKTPLAYIDGSLVLPSLQFMSLPVETDLVVIGWELDGKVYSAGGEYNDCKFVVSGTIENGAYIAKLGEKFVLYETQNGVVVKETELVVQTVSEDINKLILQDDQQVVAYEQEAKLYAEVLIRNSNVYIKDETLLEGVLNCYGKTFKAVWGKRSGVPEGETVSMLDDEEDFVELVMDVDELYQTAFVENEMTDLSQAVYEIDGQEYSISDIQDMIDAEEIHLYSPLDCIDMFSKNPEYDWKITRQEDAIHFWSDSVQDDMQFLLISFELDENGLVSSYSLLIEYSDGSSESLKISVRGVTFIEE